MKKIQLLTLSAALLSTSTIASFSSDKASILKDEKAISEFTEGKLSWVPNLPTKKDTDGNWKLENNQYTTNTIKLSWVPNLPPKKTKITFGNYKNRP